MASPQENDNKPETIITLKSYDGEVIEVPEIVAVLSVTIKNMVEDGCAGGVIPLEEVDAETLSWVITYLKKHANLIPTNIAKFIMNKRMGTVRKLFGIENDYTPEEEEAVMREHQWAHEEGVESDED
ncbi:PREDICTED: SKP1-like protein 1B [Erythranthe guttata]|uniref:SKP1-like protein 1B n=1 Tax=Erythranthe guttata TaxID=4155 RepID=UPI00064E0ADB|nr:PREDICTED: SKP1-like protein 1B [Erythranthe guttata]|eukprot:XP_012833684.1 PREDICTED: SKP1-like protein 1B [Erythranthe guttata]